MDKLFVLIFFAVFSLYLYGAGQRRTSSTRSDDFPLPPVPAFNAGSCTSESMRRLASFLIEQEGRYLRAVTDFNLICRSNPRVSSEWRRQMLLRFESLAKSYQWKKLSRANRDILSHYERTSCCEFIQESIDSIVQSISDMDSKLSPRFAESAASGQSDDFRVFSVGGGQVVLVNWETGVFVTNKLPQLTHRQRKDNIRAHQFSRQLDEQHYIQTHPDDPGLLNYRPTTSLDYKSGNIIAIPSSSDSY